MKMTIALLALSAGLCFGAAVDAAEINVQRNTPAIIDGVLYPMGGKPLVLPNMEVLLAAFPATQSKLNAVANLTDQSVVQVIVVDPMVDANVIAIDRARSDNQRDVDRLQAAITANLQFRADLESRMVAVGTVMAAEIAPNGVLIIYALS